MINYRHGDMALFQIAELPKGLTPSGTNILHTGSSNNVHSFKGGTHYQKKSGENILGYLVAQNTTLFHLEHGNICSICGYDKLIGDISVCPKCKTNFVIHKKVRLAKIKNVIYEIRAQIEITNQGMRQVVD